MIDQKIETLPEIWDDLMGGLIASIIALPISLAFGVSSGLGAAAGLYGAIACGILVALLGGTPAMISGPTGPVTVGVAAIALSNPGKPEVVFAAAIVAGLIQIVFGRLKLGQLVLYIPHPVVSGFMTGIGIIIISIQILPLCGFTSQGDIFDIFATFAAHAGDSNAAAVILGLTTIISIYSMQLSKCKIPPLLVALLCLTTVSVYFNFDVPRIGEIPSGLPRLSFPGASIQDLHIVITGGLSIAILGAMDSLLTAVMIDRVMRTRHDSNRELVGQGIANIVAGLIGGIPGSGTTMPSIVNIGSGGKSKLSALFCGILLLITMLQLGSFAALIPLSVLAGILITVGISIIDKKSLLAMRTASGADITVMIVVVGLTVFVDLIVAVCIGVALASTLFAKRLADSQQSDSGRLETLDRWQHLTDQLPTKIHKHIFIYDFIGPVFFGEVKNFLEASATLEKANCIILRFNNVPFVDQSGAYALEDAIDNWKSLSIRIVFVGINISIKSTLEDIGFSFEQSNFFATTEEAIKAIANSTDDSTVC